MSKLLKSKFLLGVTTVAIMLGGVAVNATTVAAADCTITHTLKVGSKGAEVKCLQAALDNGLVGDGVFGPKTKAQVMAFQSAHGLKADGVFGAKSRAAWVANGSVSGNFPPGCQSASGYSMTTGLLCNSIPSMTNGCPAGALYNPSTGALCSGVTPPAQTGPVTVSLSTDNPASAYIIANQATADLAHFTFSGSGTLNTVVLQRTGVSDQNTLTNVYLYKGNTRLTDGYSFNNAGQLTMNGLGIAVSGSVTLSVKADVANVTNASSLGITLVSFTAAGGTAMTVNIRGNEMTYGQGNLATAYLGTQTVTGTPTVNAGTSAYTVWSAPIQVNVRAVWLKGANFRMVGSAPADALGNIHLFIDGVSTGAAATMGTITGSNYAMFDFATTPVSLSTGSHTVDLRADIVKGSSYTVQLSIQQASDLVLFDGQVGVNIAVLGPAGAAFTSNNAATITINAGSASVVVDPSFQSMTNITGGATNTVVGRFKVHGYGEDVKVSSLLVTPLVASATAGSCTTNSSGVTTAGTCGLNNVTVYFNGSQVGSSQTWTGSTASPLTFNLGSQMILPAGTDSYVEVRADLQTTGSVNYTAGSISANLVGGTNNAQGQTSHTTLNFPTATVTGTVLTVQTGVLAVSKNAGYASQNVNPNTDNVKLGSYVLQNQSSSESVRVTSLLIALTTDGSTALTSSTTPPLTNFSNLRTSEASGSGATPIQPAASNTFSVDFTLAPGATKVIDVLGSTGATASNATLVTTLKVTSIGSSSNVSINQNGTGTAVTGQTITLAIGTISNNIATVTGTATTAQQFVPAATVGATNAAKATFKIQATGGSANISEMKFTVNSQDFSAASTDADAGTTGAQTLTLTTSADTAKFAVGDSVQLVAATTNGLGTVTAISAPNLTVYVAVASTGTPSAVRLVPNTVTGICTSSDGVTCSSASVSPVAGVAYLTNLSLTVPNGGSGLSQAVLVSYAPVGTSGISSGSTSRIALEYIKYSSGNATGTLCTAAIATCTNTAGAAAVQAAGTVAAPTMKLVGSAPTITLASSSSTLVVGSVDIGSVVVTANAKGDITLNALPINVSRSGSDVVLTADANGGGDGTVNDIIVKDKDGNPVTTTNTVFGSTTAGGTSTITFTSGYQILAGKSQTFHIFYSVATASNTNGAHTDSLSLGLGNADLLSWTDTGGNATTSNGLDVAGSAATTVSNRYLDRTTTTPGFFYNYPSNTVSVSS